MFDIILIVVCLLLGAGSMYFVLKNNPKYLNMEKLSKEAIADLKSRAEEALKKL